jgi:hypothetical protein
MCIIREKFSNTRAEFWDGAAGKKKTKEREGLHELMCHFIQSGADL